GGSGSGAGAGDLRGGEGTILARQDQQGQDGGGRGSQEDRGDQPAAAQNAETAGRGEPQDGNSDADGRVDPADAVEYPQGGERFAVIRVAVGTAQGLGKHARGDGDGADGQKGGQDVEAEEKLAHGRCSAAAKMVRACMGPSSRVREGRPLPGRRQ